MSLSTYENMPEVPVLRPTTHRLKGVNGVLKCKETFSSYTKYQGKLYKFDIYVTDSENNLLSRPMAEEMNLVKLNIQEVQGGSQIGLMKGEPFANARRRGYKVKWCNSLHPS